MKKIKKILPNNRRPIFEWDNWSGLQILKFGELLFYILVIILIVILAFTYKSFYLLLLLIVFVIIYIPSKIKEFFN